MWNNVWELHLSVHSQQQSCGLLLNRVFGPFLLQYQGGVHISPYHDKNSTDVPFITTVRLGLAWPKISKHLTTRGPYSFSLLLQSMYCAWHVSSWGFFVMRAARNVSARSWSRHPLLAVRSLVLTPINQNIYIFFYISSSRDNELRTYLNANVILDRSAGLN